jgi:hypothetical protein
MPINMRKASRSKERPMQAHCDSIGSNLQNESPDQTPPILRYDLICLDEAGDGAFKGFKRDEAFPRERAAPSLHWNKDGIAATRRPHIALLLLFVG